MLKRRVWIETTSSTTISLLFYTVVIINGCQRGGVSVTFNGKLKSKYVKIGEMEFLMGAGGDKEELFDFCGRVCGRWVSTSGRLAYNVVSRLSMHPSQLVGQLPAARCPTLEKVPRLLPNRHINPKPIIYFFECRWNCVCLQTNYRI